MPRRILLTHTDRYDVANINLNVLGHDKGTPNLSAVWTSILQVRLKLVGDPVWLLAIIFAFIDHLTAEILKVFAQVDNLIFVQGKLSLLFKSRRG